MDNGIAQIFDTKKGFSLATLTTRGSRGCLECLKVSFRPWLATILEMLALKKIILNLRHV